MKDEFCVCNTEDWCSWCAQSVPIHRERQFFVVNSIKLEEEE